MASCQPVKIAISLLLILSLTLMLGGCEAAGGAAAQPTAQVAADTAPEETAPPEEEIILPSAAARDEVFTLAYMPSYGMNPITNGCKTNLNITPLIYDGLFRINDQLRAEPALCQNYTVSDDGLTYYIFLRSGVVFHNGKALTGDDVVYSLSVAENGDGSVYAGRFDNISSYYVLEEGVVAIELHRQQETLPLLLDIPIIPNGATGGVVSGTGAYALKSDGESWLLQVNDDWWSEGKPSIRRIYLAECGSKEALRSDFESSRVDLVVQDTTGTAEVVYHGDYEAWHFDTTIMQYIGFNGESDVFSNAVARRVVSFAVDREGIVSDIMGGCARAALLPVWESSPLYKEGLAARCDYDPAEIASTLRSAGFIDYDADGVMDFDNGYYMQRCEAELLVNSENSYKLDAAQRIADALNENGFAITLKALPYDDFVDAIELGQYDMYYGEVRLTADFDLSELLGSGGSMNYRHPKYAEIDTLLEDYLANTDNAYSLYEAVVAQGLICPVLFKTHTVLTTRGSVSGLRPACDNVFYGIESWTE